eukprot:scaffold1.g5277.t1
MRRVLLVLTALLLAIVGPGGGTELPGGPGLPRASSTFTLLSSYGKCIGPLGSAADPQPIIGLLPTGCTAGWRHLSSGAIQWGPSGFCIHPAGGRVTGDDGQVALLFNECTDEPRLRFELLPGGQLHHRESGYCLHARSGDGNAPLVFFNDCRPFPQNTFSFLVTVTPPTLVREAAPARCPALPAPCSPAAERLHRTAAAAAATAPALRADRRRNASERSMAAAASHSASFALLLLDDSRVAPRCKMNNFFSCWKTMMALAEGSTLLLEPDSSAQCGAGSGVIAANGRSARGSFPGGLEFAMAAAGDGHVTITHALAARPLEQAPPGRQLQAPGSGSARLIKGAGFWGVGGGATLECTLTYKVAGDCILGDCRGGGS